MLTKKTDALNTDNIGCPHSHKASLVLENGELAGDFLSRHFESCDVCNNKLLKLKNDRKVFLKQIPFISATDEVRQIFEAESEEVANKIKKRVIKLKRKRMTESSKHLFVFLTDFKDAILSKPVLLSLCIVSSVWSYVKIFN